MKDLRMLGNMIGMLAHKNTMTDATMCKVLECEEWQYRALLAGCVMPSPKQMKDIANLFNVTIGDLLQGDLNYYEQTVVHCMGQFENPENREEILDIINDYAMLKSVVSR